MKRRFVQAKVLVFVVSGLGVAPLFSCDSGISVPTGDSPAGDTAQVASVGDQYIVARVDVEQGHTVTFYEPSPGELLIVEAKLDGQVSVSQPTQSQGAPDALALFTRLRPQDQIPPALQSAYQRAQAAALTPAAAGATLTPFTANGGQPFVAPSTTTTSKDGTNALQAALGPSSSNPDTFVNTDHGCDWGSAGSICRINWGGGFTALATSSSATCNVDHYAGNGVQIQPRRTA